MIDCFLTASSCNPPPAAFLFSKSPFLYFCCTCLPFSVTLQSPSCLHLLSAFFFRVITCVSFFRHVFCLSIPLLFFSSSPWSFSFLLYTDCLCLLLPRYTLLTFASTVFLFRLKDTQRKKLAQIKLQRFRKE